MKYTLYLIILAFLLSSCENKYFWENKTETQEYIIVEALITNKYKNQEIKLSKPLANVNDEISYISGAEVSVYENEKEVKFIEDENTQGLYVSEIPFISVIDKKYSLKITYNDSIYYAQTQPIPVSTANDIIILQNQENLLYYIDSLSVSFDSQESAMWELTVERKFGENTSDTTTSKLYFYKFTTIDVNQMFAPEKERVFFPKGTKITRKKYSLNFYHEKYLRSLLFETEWAGGYFDPAQSNPETNISGNALGFFAVSSVIIDTIYVE